MRLTPCRPVRLAVGALIPATILALSPWMPSAHADSNVQSLVTQAEHNTNTVKTLVHKDSSTVTGKGLTVKFTATGSEDEVKNREKDFESVFVTSKDASGKTVTHHYTADIIFMNGTTYYRISLQNNKWTTQKGMTFHDPYTGGWKRGRTSVSFPTSVKLDFSQVDTNGGQTHVRSPLKTSSLAGTIDLWLTSGSKPYVVKEIQDYHTTKGQSITEHVVTNFVSFNQPLTILKPSDSGST